MLANFKKINIKQFFLIGILPILILIANIRHPILAALNIRESSFIFAALPLIGLLAYMIIYSKYRQLIFNQLTFLYLASTLSICYLWFTNSNTEIIAKLSSTVIASLFFISLVNSNITHKQISIILNKTFSYILYFGYTYCLIEFFILRVFKLTTHAQINDWLFTSHNSFGHERIVGFNVAKEFAGLVLVLAWSWVYGNKTQSINPSNKWRNFVFILVGMSIPILTDSLILSLITFIFLFFNGALQIFSELFNTKQKILLLSVFAIITWYSDILNRVVSYIFRGELLRITYFPNLSECKPFDILFNFSNARIFPNMKPTCEANEFHFLQQFFSFGIMPNIIWLTLIGLSFFYILTNYKNLNKPFWQLVIIAGSLSHYSGIEAWGINYIFFLLLALAYKQNQSSFKTDLTESTI